jgi:hypothetical protein
LLDPTHTWGRRLITRLRDRVLRQIADAPGDRLGTFVEKESSPVVLDGFPMSLNNRDKFERATGSEAHCSSDRLDWDIRAADALELARMMPPGLERNEALKLASLLRCTADARGLIFAKRGRPRK